MPVLFVVVSRIVTATFSFAIIMLLLLEPVIMLGVVWVYIIFWITGISDRLLIVTAFI